MKKVITILLSVFLMLGCLISCGETENANTGDKLSVVTTIFPEYDWVKEISKGSDIDVSMLLDKGVDLHSFQPSAEDIVKISDCDLFIYVGGESDKWVEDALKEATNEDMIVLNLLDILGKSAREEELVEGMQEEDEGEESEGEVEYDEHVWLSLRNAITFCDAIEEALSAADPDNADNYKKNVENYKSELRKLDTKYKDVVKSAGCKTLLFADRFPFRYLTDDYGLKYYAAFMGCSAENEASFETITFLAKQVDKLNLNMVLTLEGTNHSVAETVVSTSKKKGVQIKSVNSLQSITSKDVEAGASYLTIMKDNLNVLSEALR